MSDFRIRAKVFDSLSRVNPASQPKYSSNAILPLVGPGFFSQSRRSFHNCRVNESEKEEIHNQKKFTPTHQKKLQNFVVSKLNSLSNFVSKFQFFNKRKFFRKSIQNFSRYRIEKLRNFSLIKSANHLFQSRIQLVFVCLFSFK